MGDKNGVEKKCLQMILDFLHDADSVKILDIIIDIYHQIKYEEINKNAIEKKFVKVLYNLGNSKTVNSILEEKDRKLLNSFLKDLLEIRCNCQEYYISNNLFSKLSLQQLISMLIEVRYLKEKELSQRKYAKY